MKICAIILLGLISCKTAQPTQPVVAGRGVVATKPYVATWVCENESWVQNYKLQKNKSNNASGWTTIGIPIVPKYNTQKNTYTYTLPKTSIPNYYRVIATGTLYDYIKKKLVTVVFPTLSIFLSNTNLK